MAADLAVLEFHSLKENLPQIFQDKVGIACLPQEHEIILHFQDNYA